MGFINSVLSESFFQSFFGFRIFVFLRKTFFSLLQVFNENKLLEEKLHCENEIH